MTDAQAASDHHADARKCMVDSQIRPNKVNDPRILAAMRHLPRERFHRRIAMPSPMPTKTCRWVMAAS